MPDPESIKSIIEFTAKLAELGVNLIKLGEHSYRYAKSNDAQLQQRGLLRSLIPRKEQIPAIDWNVDWSDWYRHERKILWLSAPGGERIFFPQSLYLDGRDVGSESAIRIKVRTKQFRPKRTEPATFQVFERLYARKEKRLFNGINARLVAATPRQWQFEPVAYFDYLKTNLALDGDTSCLRKSDIDAGRLVALSRSAYANATGVNSLVFTSDGYCVFQVRTSDVIVRPGEICSGFSGTIDFSDVEDAEADSQFSLGKTKIHREGVEELSFTKQEVKRRELLGITRELIRGGAPEVFYAVQLKITWAELASRRPQDVEGRAFAVHFGDDLARCVVGKSNRKEAEERFWHLINHIPFEARRVTGNTNHIELSVPLWTNLILWLMRSNCTNVGADRYYV